MTQAPAMLVNLKPVHQDSHPYSCTGGAVTCAEPTEELRKRRLSYLVFVLAPHGKASFTGMGLTPAQIQPCEQSPEGVVKCLGHSHFGL